MSTVVLIYTFCHIYGYSSKVTQMKTGVVNPGRLRIKVSVLLAAATRRRRLCRHRLHLHRAVQFQR
jgi:hypothetical protein